MNSNKVTLKDVAKVAGVHFTTVSMALKNHPRLPLKTRERLQKLAREMNYQSDPALSALVAYRRAKNLPKYTSTIAFINKWPKSFRWHKVQTFKNFFTGVKERAEILGYKVEEFSMDEPGMTSRRFSEILYHRNINGLIFLQIPSSRGHLRLQWDLFSAVSMGYSLVYPQIHRIANHQYQSIVLAVRQLRRMGYKRIGLALRKEMDERVDKFWSSGFLAAQSSLPASQRVSPFISTTATEAEFYEWFQESKPDVVLGYSNEMRKWAKKGEIRIPEDVAFADLDCHTDDGQRAGIFQNWKTIGVAAVDQLVGLLQRNERGIPKNPCTLLVNGRWVNGPQCPVKKAMRA